MADNSIEKNVTEYMTYENDSSPSNIKATENIVMGKLVIIFVISVNTKSYKHK
jgi:hypothetical protein